MDLAAERRWVLVLIQLAAAQAEMAHRKLYECGKSRP